MGVCLVTMVRDEIDIVEPFLRHSAFHVDWIYVLDHLSKDGTREVLHTLAKDLPLTVLTDDEPGYFQSRKMTALAHLALGEGHRWALASDADELWYVASDPEKRIADYLDGFAPDVQVVKAEIYNHIPSGADDPQERNPFLRIGWRKRASGILPKVACRLHPTLVIEAGNHSASYKGRALAVSGLALRHFSWRSAEQYAHKIEVGLSAYLATDLPEDLGVHWRMWEGASRREIVDHFYRWFFVENPSEDDSLVYDPAPYRGS